VLYAAKCYWPGVTPTQLEEVASRAERAGAASAPNVEYLGSLLFADDDVVLCLFEGPSRVAVRRASEEAGIPWERLMASDWISPCEPANSSPRRRHVFAASFKQRGAKR
jgi:hypothetical protein